MQTKKQMGTFKSPAALIPIISLTQMKIFCDNCDRLISKASYNNSRFLERLYLKINVLYNIIL